MLNVMSSPSPSLRPDLFPPPLYHSPRASNNHEESGRAYKQIRSSLASFPPSRVSRQARSQKRPFPSPPTPQPRRRGRSLSPLTKAKRRKIMVNTTTQTDATRNSPRATTTQTPTHTIAGLKIADKEQSPESSDESSSSEESAPAEPLEPAATAPPDSRGRSVSHSQAKRQAEDSASEEGEGSTAHSQTLDDSTTKKARPEAPAVRTVPLNYEFCDTRDLVTLISSMLMELIRYNDAIPLKDGHLTRFHSRAPPGISVQDYLQRLTTHATLSPPILLSMVYYIDRLCAMYPAFTITSLTVHRFLIASGTVASKGLSDSFWTNKTYARVGGVSIKELALLELEFLTRLDWRIVPKPEVLCDYYVSLVKRSDTHRLEAEDGKEAANG